MSQEYLKPIYLHFLDRELRSCVQFQPSDSEMINFIETALLLTMDKLYISNSLLWENLNLFPQTIKTILELERYEAVQILSNHVTIDEFIESRRRLYIKDQVRYPMYFNDRLKDMPWGKNILYIEDSTTEWLVKELNQWTMIKSDKTFPTISYEELVKPVKELIGETLISRGGNAVTYHLFQKANQEKTTEFYIRRIISFLYTQRFLELMDGAILTGINGLAIFDQISKNSTKFNYEFNRQIFKQLGLKSKGDLPIQEKIESLLLLRSDPMYKVFLLELRSFLKGISYLAESQPGQIMRQKINNLIKRYITIPGKYSGNGIKLEIAITSLLSINNMLKTNEPTFREGYLMVKKIEQIKKVLLVTATNTELKTLIEVFKVHGSNFSRETYGNYTYLSFGRIGNVEVYAFKTEMGYSGAGGSILAIKEAVDYITPDYLISVGIAFGLRKGKQKLGDILVSRQLKNYETAKIKELEAISRGDKISASTLLLDRLSQAELEWEKCGVHFGLILSGEKLVNSEEFIRQLLKTEPEAIVGEMEGAGLMSVCQNVKSDWVLIKAICDWGYGKTDNHQVRAAENVMEFVYLTLSEFL